MGVFVCMCLPAHAGCALQGSAADIVKGVMVCLQEQLVSTGLAQHCHMLLQVRGALRRGPNSVCCWRCCCCLVRLLGMWHSEGRFLQ
jgi:hypothetical protein